MDFLRHHPLGARVPDSVHAVCASLPALADVIAYEEGAPRVMSRIDLGYPRFVQHLYLRRVAELFRHRNGLSGHEVFLTASENAARRLVERVRATGAAITAQEGFAAVHFPSEPEAGTRARLFLQHTGWGLSSREAEDVLVREGLLPTRQEEEVVGVDAISACEDALGAAAGARSRDDVFLCRSGMSAFYASFLAIQRAQAARGRDVWVQIGWLYLDTQRILEKFTGGAASFIWLHDPSDQRAIDEVFSQHGSRIAGVVTETPTNPLMQTGDVRRIAELARRHGAALVLDPSSVGLANVDVLPHADGLVVSLTKYAGNRGDVMAGLVVVNGSSPFAGALREGLAEYIEPLYSRDAARLAWTLRDMEAVAREGNANTIRLVAWLEAHASVRRVHWAGSEAYRRNYEAIARGPNRPGALLSVELNRPLAEVYDRLRVVKAASFGVRFTMACPFLYLTHFDKVRSESGRRFLRDHGLEPDLLRVSAGIEPFDRIREVFDEALL
jgi:cystathionine gamma-synthase